MNAYDVLTLVVAVSIVGATVFGVIAWPLDRH